MPETPASAPPIDGLSRNPRIRTVPFDMTAVELIAQCLGVEASLAPFRLPSSAVWQMMVPGSGGRPQAMLTLWPGIRRIDVIAGPATIVFTDLRNVDLVPEVEVQFRRANRELLIVARGGKVIVRA
ncbi:MAG: hypothetical protein H0V37_14800 [Chloroflexia bacterium]|nr:hypothetical protein [Chloroflexia bacterium]